MTQEELKLIGIDPSFHQSYDKINWDQYFMSIAFLVAKRSPDANTRHGGLLVKNNKIISTGYNGFVCGADDTVLPNTRPYKYLHMIHCETNLICNAAKTGSSIEGATLYITGYPCKECTKLLINCGILNWHVGHIGHQESVEDSLLRKYYINLFKVNIVHYRDNYEKSGC